MSGGQPAGTVAALEAEWPLWEVWLVRQYIGGTAWCARRRDDHKVVLNAYSAAELAGMIEAAVTGDVPGPDAHGSPGLADADPARSTPAPVRRAQKRRHDAERDPERAYAIVVAELMAIDEPMSRQFLGGSLPMVAADVLYRWQSEIGQAGYPDGLRGYVAAYVRQVDGHAGPGEMGAVWAAHIAGLRAGQQPE